MIVSKNEFIAITSKVEKLLDWYNKYDMVLNENVLEVILSPFFPVFEGMREGGYDIATEFIIQGYVSPDAGLVVTDVGTLYDVFFAQEEE